MVKTGDKSENRQHDAHVKEYYKIKKKNEEKDISHISWKNHNVGKYIKDSMQEYLKIQEKRK
jgi:hypothetical protein